MKVTYQHEYSYDDENWFSWDKERDFIEDLADWDHPSKKYKDETIKHRIVKITREVVEGPND